MIAFQSFFGFSFGLAFVMLALKFISWNFECYTPSSLPMIQRKDWKRFFTGDASRVFLKYYVTLQSLHL